MLIVSAIHGLSKFDYSQGSCHEVRVSLLPVETVLTPLIKKHKQFLEAGAIPWFSIQIVELCANTGETKLVAHHYDGVPEKVKIVLNKQAKRPLETEFAL